MWKIQDVNGVIYSGTQEEMQLIWDLTTRSIDDLASEYRSTYSKTQIKALKKEHSFSWTGDLELVEVHNTFR